MVQWVAYWCLLAHIVFALSCCASCFICFYVCFYIRIIYVAILNKPVCVVRASGS